MDHIKFVFIKILNLVLCKWIVASAKWDNYGIVVSQLPSLLAILFDVLEALEKVDTEQTVLKKVKSPTVISLIDGSF